MKNILSILLLHFVTYTFAQRELQGIGNWEYHIPQNKGVAIAKAGEKIYSASNFGLFSYNKSTKEITHYTKVNGLSDVQINYIAYYEPLDVLMIAYKNTNIDIIQNNTITNFNDILRKQIVGEKSISHIHFNNDLAYIATTFGVVVFDLDKLEIKETYSSLDENGGSMKVYQSTTLNDSLYLATDEGILAASLSNQVNLLDFNNWKNIHPQNGGYKNVASFDNSIWALQNDTSIVEKYNLGNWDIVNEYTNINSLSTSNESLILINDTEVHVLNKTGDVSVISLPTNYNVIQLIPDNQNSYWMSDLTKGLVKYENEKFTSLTPKGPSNGSIFNINYSNNALYVVQGGYDIGTVKQFKSFSVDKLAYNGWATTGYWQDDALQGITDATEVVSHDNITYYATNSEGIVKNDNGVFTVYNDKNSPLRSIFPGTSGYVRAPSISLDSEKNLWIANHNVPQGDTSIFKLDQDGNWSGYAFPTITSSRMPLKIFVDDNNFKWVILSSTTSGDGVLVFDDEEDNKRLLSKGFENGDLQDNKVNDIAFGKDGAVWMVGRAGVSVFQNPINIFEGGEDNDASKPIFEGRPLMENEYCTSIAIDGGNRKWIGTENGLFLMSESGTQQLLNFNTKNSPLPTNKINTLEIHPVTGELFIGTDLGLISYRSDASDGNSACEGQIKVFPNPVEPSFDGEVGIAVLTNNAEVKITDVWGNLVYETEANGGTCSWNLKDYNDNNVATGVYMILVNGIGRKKSCTERLAIIR